MNNLLLQLLLCLTLVACSAKEEEKTLTKQEIIAQTQWCTINRVTDEFSVVTRRTFLKGGSKEEFFGVNNNSAPLLYRYKDHIDWDTKDDGFIWSDKLSVELLRGFDQVSAYENFNQQKNIFEQVLSKNATLTKNNLNFKPELALIVKVEDAGLFADNKVNTETLYPCTNYSSSFEVQSPSRPLIEFKISFLQETLPAILSVASKVDLMTPLRFDLPITELTMDQIELENTQWCSWFPMDFDHLTLETITIGHDKYLTNTHSEVTFEIYPNEVDRLKALAQNATYSQSYSMSKDNGKIRGKNIVNLGSGPVTIDHLFTIVKDSNGARALVKLNPYYPDSLSLMIDEIYFDCADPRPLKYSTGFRKNLKTILDLQLKQLKN